MNSGLDNGFLGLNIEKAVSDINNFENAAVYASHEIINSFNLLYNVLNNNWASPIAVEFTTSNSAEIGRITVEILKTIDKIYVGAVEAARSLAAANGSSFPLSPNHSTANTLELSVCVDNLNGVTGMDVQNVSNALNEFNNNINRALNLLSGVPDGIAFYDPEGHLLGGYHQNIMDFKEKYTALADGTSSKIRGYLIDEQTKITKAKEAASNVLSS